MRDPTPLRYRTYLWFPVLTVGWLAASALLSAVGVDSSALSFLQFFSLAGLYVAALLGLHGLFRDVASLDAADVDWRPSARRYTFALALVAAGTTAVVLVPPVAVPDSQPLGPVGALGAVVVSLSLATGPVCAAHLLRRWRRVGLNYL